MKNLLLSSVGLALIAAGAVVAQDNAPKPDNTKMNSGDAQKGALTADQQKSNSEDRHLTQKIRQAVIADKSLSMYGHNVKIIAHGGKVTLKGPVRSDEEKQSIASKAADVAGGADHVDNQLTVKPSK